MADTLNQMAVFARVVATGSLSAAARELSLSPAMVSRRLAALEARLGVRLVNRTTRSLHLTDEGAQYYESCARVLAEIEQADAEVSAGRQSPRGALRVALPASFGNQYVAPLVPQFARRYPDVQLLLSLSDRTVNLVEEGFDLAIRIANLADSSLAARKLAPNRRVVCASPAYLARHGVVAIEGPLPPAPARPKFELPEPPPRVHRQPAPGALHQRRTRQGRSRRRPASRRQQRLEGGGPSLGPVIGVGR